MANMQGRAEGAEEVSQAEAVLAGLAWAVFPFSTPKQLKPA